MLPGAAATLAELDRRGVPWWIVSNDASRPPELLAQAYPEAVGPERILSSGLVLRRHLEGRSWDPGARLAYLGPPSSAAYLEGLGPPVHAVSELEDLERVALVGLMDEFGFEWQRELTRVVNLVRRRPQVELVAPNPDRLFPDQGGRVGLGAGSLAALLEAVLDRPVPHFGKPGPALFELALERAREQLPDLRPEQVLMVGDTLATDVAGAQPLGLRTLLLLSGNETPAGWQAAAARLGLQPDHVLPGLG